jgi:hypothetical protein
VHQVGNINQGCTTMHGQPVIKKGYCLFASHAATKQKRTGCIGYMLQYKTTRVVYMYKKKKKKSDTPVCVMK